jgi:hypothetical protein
MTVKERVLKRVEELDEARLSELERELEAKDKTALTLEEELRLWDELSRTLEDASPEDRAAFEEATRRRPLFGGRTLALKPDPESQRSAEE